MNKSILILRTHLERLNEAKTFLIEANGLEEPVFVDSIVEEVPYDKEKDEDYKVAWKDIENLVKADYDAVKVTYSRADKYEGHLAISTFKASKS